MADPFIGEIRMFGGDFAPNGWLFCDGQLLSIAQNDTLFALIGTTYGGDGQNTFAVPDLRGRVPVHQGSAVGSATRVIGSSGGSQQVALTVGQIPAHVHETLAARDGVRTQSPLGAVHAIGEADVFVSAPADALQSGLSAVGGNQPHANEQPVQCVNFIISLFGIFPSQN